MARPAAKIQQDYFVDDPTRPVNFKEKWSPAVLFKVGLYFALCFTALDALPNTIWDPQLR